MQLRNMISLILLLPAVLWSQPGSRATETGDAITQTDAQQKLVEAVRLAKDKKFEAAGLEFGSLLQHWQIHASALIYLKICRDSGDIIDKKKASDVFKGVYEVYAGNYEKAGKQIQKVIKKYKDYAPLYIVQADILANLGEHEKAMQAYDKAIERMGGSPLAYLFRGKYHAAAGELDPAIADFSRVIAADSTAAISFFERGFVYCLQKKYSLAISDFQKAGVYYPDWQMSTVVNEAYHNRGLLQIERGEYQGAVFDLNHAITINPDFLNSYLSRGIAYRHLKAYGKAIADFDHCIEKNPKFADAYYNRGLTSYERRLYEKAATDLLTAVKLVPSDQQMQFKLAESYYRLGRYAAAVKHFEKTIALDNSYYWAYYWQGYSYDGLRNARQAITAFENFLSLVPKTYSRQISAAQMEIRRLKKQI